MNLALEVEKWDGYWKRVTDLSDAKRQLGRLEWLSDFAFSAGSAIKAEEFKTLQRQIEGRRTPPPAAGRLLTPEDVAQITGLSIETLAQWRSQRRGISYVKLSRNCVRYRQADLDRWLEERIVRVEQDPSNARRNH